MNPISKLYCRTFQTVFKLAIPLLPYRDPKIIYNIPEIARELEKNNITNVLIVTDATLESLGMTSNLKSTLSTNKINYFVYDKTVPNPTVNNVEEARQLYIEKSCNGIIGFGGGSSIDCAKAVGARIAKPKKPIAKMRGILKIRKKIPYLCAIPTTAGTGSEVTVTTVITDSQSGHKFPISDFPLIPKLAVLDADNTKTMPAAMTATTGMDALTHAVEAFIGNSTTKSTRKDALEAVRLIFENLETAYNEPTNTKARENMLKAAFLAGRAFSKSYVGYIHAIAHSLGGKYNTPHGLANAVILPWGLEAYGKSIYKKLYRLALAAGISKESDDPKTAAEAFIAKIKAMNKKMNIPNRLYILKEDIPEMAKHAATEANPLYPVPVLMNTKELEFLYYKIADRSQK